MSEVTRYSADIYPMDSPTPIRVAVVVLASDYDRDIQVLRLQVAALTATGKVLGGGLDLVLPQRDQLAADNKRLREALSTTKYRIEQGRVWNGMGWSPSGLHPLGQQKALDVIGEALSSGKEVM